MTPFTEETTQETECEAFHIDTDQAAEWLLRKLANIEAEKARITAQAAEMVRQLDCDAQRLRHLYEGELLDYAAVVLQRTATVTAPLRSSRVLSVSDLYRQASR